jgi:hypothetical protein
MENNETRYILIFRSYNQAMLLYDKLLKRGCNVELISTPCKLSKGCSQSLSFGKENVKEVIEEAKNNKIEISNIYKVVRKGKTYNYIHI